MLRRNTPYGNIIYMLIQLKVTRKWPEDFLSYQEPSPSIWRKRYQLELTLDPFYKFLKAKNLHGSAFSSHATLGTVKFLSCKQYCNLQENLHVPSKRVAQVNSSGPMAFIFCRPCKDHTEKEVSRKNNEGKGYGGRAVGTPLMVLFNKSSFPILPVYQILVNPMNGLFWQLLSTVYILMEMLSDSDEIIS